MKLGLCLAGGGVKGAAHIGVLKAFEEENIKFEYLAGTSSGSIIATMYSMGYNSEEIYELFKEYCKKIKYVDGLNFFSIIIGLLFERKLKITGLNNGKKLENIIENVCKKKNIYYISEIKKKLIIPSVDLNDGKIYFFSSINNNRGYSDKIIYINDIEIWRAVRASCSYPGVFTPCDYNGTKLIDGGIRENVPWRELKEIGVDKIISVIFTKQIKKKDDKNIIDVVSNSIDILCHELSNYELDGADFLLKINTPDISLLDTSKTDYLYKIGYEQTKEKMKTIKKYIYEKK